MEQQSTIYTVENLISLLESEHLSEIRIYQNPVNWINKAIIATATSGRHLNALMEKLKRTPLGKPKIEGLASSGWIILDFPDFVLHLFEKEKREYYTLDELWESSKKQVEKAD